MLSMLPLTFALFAATVIGCDDPNYPSSNMTCPTNNTRTVSPNETCQSIAAIASVSTGDLQALNSPNPECTNMEANSTICLPGACTTYLVKAGDTCTGIASSHNNMSLSTFFDMNPTIDSTDCSNLLSDTNVCLTKPAGPTIDIPDTSTRNGKSHEVRDTKSGKLAPKTQMDCKIFYQVQTGDICSTIAANHNISVAWFEAQNPSIDAGGTNLETGLLYCVQKMGDDHSMRNATVGRRSGHRHAMH